MEKEIRLNLDVLGESGLSINEVCALWNIYHNLGLDFKDNGIDYERLQDKQFIKIITDEKNRVKFVLRQKATHVLGFLSKGIQPPSNRRKKEKPINVDIVSRLDEFRHKWKGLKLGSMGSLASCKSKLGRWMEENPTYTFDEVLKAADLYIDSLRGDYRYLQRADYFIYKQEGGKEEVSRLSAFIDEIDDNFGATGDWTSQLN